MNTSTLILFLGIVLCVLVTHAQSKKCHASLPSHRRESDSEYEYVYVVDGKAETVPETKPLKCSAATAKKARSKLNQLEKRLARLIARRERFGVNKKINKQFHVLQALVDKVSQKVVAHNKCVAQQATKPVETRAPIKKCSSTPVTTAAPAQKCSSTPVTTAAPVQKCSSTPTATVLPSPHECIKSYSMAKKVFRCAYIKNSSCPRGYRMGLPPRDETQCIIGCRSCEKIPAATVPPSQQCIKSYSMAKKVFQCTYIKASSCPRGYRMGLPPRDENQCIIGCRSCEKLLTYTTQRPNYTYKPYQPVPTQPYQPPQPIPTQPYQPSQPVPTQPYQPPNLTPQPDTSAPSSPPSPSYTPDTPAPYSPDTPAPYSPDTPAPYSPDTPAPYSPDTPAPYVPDTPAPYVPGTPNAPKPKTHKKRKPAPKKHKRPVHKRPVHKKPVHKRPVHKRPVHKRPVHKKPVHKKHKVPKRHVPPRRPVVRRRPPRVVRRRPPRVVRRRPPRVVRRPPPRVVRRPPPRVVRRPPPRVVRRPPPRVVRRPPPRVVRRPPPRVVRRPPPRVVRRPPPRPVCNKLPCRCWWINTRAGKKEHCCWYNTCTGAPTGRCTTTNIVAGDIHVMIGDKDVNVDMVGTFKYLDVGKCRSQILVEKFGTSGTGIREFALQCGADKFHYDKVSGASVNGVALGANQKKVVSGFEVHDTGKNNVVVVDVLDEVTFAIHHVEGMFLNIQSHVNVTLMNSETGLSQDPQNAEKYQVSREESMFSTYQPFEVLSVDESQFTNEQKEEAKQLCALVLAPHEHAACVRDKLISGISTHMAYQGHAKEALEVHHANKILKKAYEEKYGTTN